MIELDTINEMYIILSNNVNAAPFINIAFDRK